MSSRVASERAVVLRYVEPQAEEEVVPDEHLHVRRLRRVQRHDATVDDGHSTSRGGGDKVTVGLDAGIKTVVKSNTISSQSRKRKLFHQRAEQNRGRLGGQGRFYISCTPGHCFRDLN